MSANLDYGSGVGLSTPLLDGTETDAEETGARSSRRREVFLCTYLFTMLTVVGGVCLRIGVEHWAMKTCHDFETSLSAGAPPKEYPRWGRG